MRATCHISGPLVFADYSDDNFRWTTVERKDVSFSDVFIVVGQEARAPLARHLMKFIPELTDASDEEIVSVVRGLIK